MSRMAIVVTPAPPSEQLPCCSVGNPTPPCSYPKSPTLKVLGRQSHYRDLNSVCFRQLIGKRSASSHT